LGFFATSLEESEVDDIWTLSGVDLYLEKRFKSKQFVISEVRA